MNLFVLSQCASVHRILGWKYGMEPRTSVPLAGFIIIEDQLIFLFSNYWPALSREGSQASRKNICLSKARPVRITALFHLLLGLPHAFNFIKDSPSSTRISYAPKSPLSVTPFYLCHIHKEMKGLRGRKTSAILFIHERNSHPHRPHKLRCTTGALRAKKRGEHGISRVFVSLGS